MDVQVRKEQMSPRISYLGYVTHEHSDPGLHLWRHTRYCGYGLGTHVEALGSNPVIGDILLFVCFLILNSVRVVTRLFSRVPECLLLLFH